MVLQVNRFGRNDVHFEIVTPCPGLYERDLYHDLPKNEPIMDGVINTEIDS